VDRRDQDAFAELVRRHGPMVFRAARRFLPCSQDAEDVYQAVFLILARRAAAVRWQESVANWLYGVTYRVARRARAAAATRQAREARVPSRRAADPLAELSVREVQGIFDEELARLPETIRAPLVLCCLEGRTRDEAAEQLGWSAALVKSRLEQARERLRARLVRRGVTLSAALLGAALAEQGSAAVPTPLAVATVRAAMLVAAGRAAAAGAISEPVAALVEGVLKPMLLTKLKAALAVLLGVTLCGGTTAWLLRAAPAVEVPPSGGPPPTKDTALKEGWRKTTPIPLPELGEGDEYVAWVEKGWLQVKRQTKEGKTDWHILLARATDPKPPTFAAPKGGISLDVSYRDGRYFIRETSNVLRCVRERKRGADGTLPRHPFLDKEFREHGSAGSPEHPPLLTGWVDKSWFLVASGPDDKHFDCLLRLNPAGEAGKGWGFTATRDGLQRAFHGETWVLDDGELLTATRALEAEVKAKRARDEARARLVGAAAPAIDGKEWFNTRQGPTWEDLRGKVVLLDFWATWCGPCVQKLPEVQALCEKYREKGLVVIAVHSPQGIEKLPEFLAKHKLPFPVVADGGQTLERYAIELLPSYVLVDRNGKVVRGVSNSLPKAEEIERYLGK
jgi:RNA polymerase sigma factor (sigma-70 family)